ncbi:hypothetical protein BCR43DRAFT_562016 [Syncephalastrum racemosum]|uniref:Uncharacterized protein n=1 Tax=Syncephalastrum racemosum TaxID=13706 RepID=A0A1X2HHG6_SYNRA|nr:hypothetical protein BCR43DRAFT_562016 [Syncephalastrum racemosum]
MSIPPRRGPSTAPIIARPLPSQYTRSALWSNLLHSDQPKSRPSSSGSQPATLWPLSVSCPFCSVNLSNAQTTKAADHIWLCLTQISKGLQKEAASGLEAIKKCAVCLRDLQTWSTYSKANHILSHTRTEIMEWFLDSRQPKLIKTASVHDDDEDDFREPAIRHVRLSKVGQRLHREDPDTPSSNDPLRTHSRKRRSSHNSNSHPDSSRSLDINLRAFHDPSLRRQSSSQDNASNPSSNAPMLSSSPMRTSTRLSMTLEHKVDLSGITYKRKRPREARYETSAVSTSPVSQPSIKPPPAPSLNTHVYDELESCHGNDWLECSTRDFIAEGNGKGSVDKIKQDVKHMINDKTENETALDDTKDDPFYQDDQNDLDNRGDWDDEDDEDEDDESVMSSEDERVSSAPSLPLDQLLERNLPETIDEGISRQHLLEHMLPMVQYEPVRERVVRILERILYFIDDRRLARLTYVKEGCPYWEMADLDFVLELIHQVKEPHIMASIYYILDKYDIKAISAADVIERFVLLHSSFARMFCLIAFIRSRIPQDPNHTRKYVLPSDPSEDVPQREPATIVLDGEADGEADEEKAASLQQDDEQWNLTADIYSIVLDEDEDESPSAPQQLNGTAATVAVEDDYGKDKDNIAVPEQFDEEDIILRELSNIEGDDDSFFDDPLGDNEPQNRIPNKSSPLKVKKDAYAHASVIIDLSGSPGSKADEDEFSFYQELMDDEDK